MAMISSVTKVDGVMVLPAMAGRKAWPAGVAMGVLDSPQGYRVLRIEASRQSGDGRVHGWGELGGLLQAQALALLPLVLARAVDRRMAAAVLEAVDVGVGAHDAQQLLPHAQTELAVFMALASLFSARTLMPGVLWAGAVGPTGRLRPVANVQACLQAAQRMGLHTLALPAAQQSQAALLRPGCRCLWLDSVDEVLDAALQKP